MISEKIGLDEDKLAEFCRKWRITKLEIFGSVLSDEFSPDSDIDFLYTFEPGAKQGLLDIIRMEKELSGIVGREIDLVSRLAVERSSNWIRRNSILNNTEVVYAER